MVVHIQAILHLIQLGFTHWGALPPISPFLPFLLLIVVLPLFVEPEVVGASQKDRGVRPEGYGLCTRSVYFRATMNTHAPTPLATFKLNMIHYLYFVMSPLPGTRQWGRQEHYNDSNV